MTSTELAVRTGSSNTLESKIKYAQALAGANLLPASYRNQPANVLLAIELGESLGISSIQAINGIHVIEGRPSASADLIASMVRRAGHKLRVRVDDEHNVATAQIIRADDPDFTYTAIWNEAKARAAGLWGKGNWGKHPGQMLRNRAITEVCRMGASDALYGVIYTPEELGAETDSEGNPITVTQVEPPKASAAKPPTLREAVAARQALAPEPEPESNEPELITAAQLTKLAILIRENGLTRDEALPYFGSLVDREITSTKELTRAEASTVIDALEHAKAADADPVTGEVPIDAELVEDWPTTPAA